MSIGGRGGPYGKAYEDILDRVEIVDQISETMRLRKSGANYIGSCPFHQEKTPSLLVSPAKGIYKCFGCGKAGNVVNYYMGFYKLSWTEAIEELAKKNHIEMSFTRDMSVEQDKLKRHRAVLEATAQFYHKNVWSIKDYIHSRGITDRSIEQYTLGSSNPSTYTSNISLIRHLYSMGFTTEDMFSQGLIIPKQGQDSESKNPADFFERFTGRLMFPIYDDRGRITGFSGRILPEFEDKTRIAKYLNSPETDLYKKSMFLYGMNVIREQIMKKGYVYVVEGYTDVILMNQEGLPTVGKSGTSFKDLQARKLAKYVKNIFIVGDNDAPDIDSPNPGLNAAKKDFAILLPHSISTRAIVLPPQEDPASYLQKYSKEDFEKLEKLNLAQLHIRTSNISDPDKKIAVLEKIVEELSYIEDPLKKYLWIQEVGKSLGIPDIFIARKYTTKLSEDIKENNVLDYFSKAYINELGAKFIAKLLLTPPKFAMPYLRDVPLSDIPDDGSIFSKRMFNLYATLSEKFSMGDFQMSLFGMDVSTSDRWNFLEEDMQRDFRSKNMIYSLENPELGRALYEVTKIPGVVKSSRKKGMSKSATPTEPEKQDNSYDLDTLARLLRSEIFLKKQNILLSQVSQGLMSGEDISDLVDEVEKLHHRV